MASGDIRILHSSDWHLERPLHGLSSAPDEMRELLREAPYLAAQRVVETALVESVDALLLSGDIVDVERAGARAVVFLQEQFAKLEARGIPVYWSSGLADRLDNWPRMARLPQSVHRFPTGRVEQFDLVREGKTIARIQGASADQQGRVESTGFHRDAHGTLTLGLAYGTSDTPGREGDRVHYMALGGRHRRATVDTEPGIAHYCGTHQGRSPEESGPCGATLIVVEQGRVTTKFVATDVVRWSDEVVEITAATTLEQLEDRLAERIEKFRTKNYDSDHFVTWHLRGVGQLLHQLRPGPQREQLLTKLRNMADHRKPLVWSVDIECDAAVTVPEEWYDQETILGDVLRQIREFEQDASLPLDFKKFLPESLPTGIDRERFDCIEPAHRAAVIENAKRLSIDLLTSPKAASYELQSTFDGDR